uniref:Peptidase A2 domain-containing protein n=1 Tax=Nymphaea colorata TaxID=210225 RepID=A0A5K1C6E3_9MAGN
MSFHALAGDDALQVIRVEGKIKGHQINILMDIGSTHNFVCDKMAKACNYIVVDQPEFKVMVGTGSSLVCAGRYPQEAIEIQGQRFTVELFPLAMGGADVVLGIQWLQQISKVEWDFKNMSVTLM